MRTIRRAGFHRQVVQPGFNSGRRAKLQVLSSVLRKRLKAEGAEADIPGRSNRKVPVPCDETRYKGRWRIEAAFCRLKDFPRIATRHDKLARNVLSAVALATLVAFGV